MFSNKCAKCEKTQSKCRFIGWEGKYLCRKCYNKVKRESEKTLLVDDTDATVTAASNNPAEAGTHFSKTFIVFFICHVFMFRIC